MKYKLYVWEDVLQDYTSGIAFAVARSPEEARDKIATAYAVGFGHQDDEYIRKHLAGAPDEYELAASPGFALHGGG